MAAKTTQLCWEDVQEGDEVPAVTFQLTIQRMIMSAASNRDFAPHHHNTAMGRADGAPDMHMNADSCMQMWERVVSDWMGTHGRVKRVTFRITTFNAAGDTVTVSGKVAKKWQENALDLLQLAMKSEHARGLSMQGTVVVALPSRSDPTATPRWSAPE